MKAIHVGTLDPSPRSLIGNRPKSNFLSGILLILLIAGHLAVYAQPPQMISHQGRISVDGVHFDGPGLFKFALVDGGTDISVQAAASPVINSGFITAVNVTNPGAGYESAPVVTFHDHSGSGSGALATAVISGGSVTGIVSIIPETTMPTARPSSSAHHPRTWST